MLTGTHCVLCPGTAAVSCTALTEPFVAHRVGYASIGSPIIA